MADYSVGNLEGALEALEESVELSGGDGAVDWLFLAMTHAKSGDRAKARVCYDKAIPLITERQPASDELLRYRDEAAELLALSESDKASGK